MTAPTIKVGDRVERHGVTYAVTHLVGADRLVVKNTMGAVRVFGIDEIAPPEPAQTAPLQVSERATNPPPAAFSDEEWGVATHRASIVRPLAEMERRKRADVEKAAKDANVSTASVYEWLASWRKGESVASLVPDRRGRPEGATRIDPTVDAIVFDAIDRLYLSRRKTKAAAVAREVELRCNTAGLETPHPATVRRRIARLDSAAVLRAQGRQDLARGKHEPIRGAFPGADRPFDVVQIDHTIADVMVVDERHRRELGRPTLTLAIDVATRMIAGHYVSMAKPSANSVGICLARAMLAKADLLRKLGVEGSWPVQGVMGKVHSDNGREFHGRMLERACAEYGIDLEWRPVKKPNFGGHIERLMGTAANEIRSLPGATFSNPRERRGALPTSSAAMTLQEFDAWLTQFFVNVYHQRIHSGLGRAPIRAWEDGTVGTPDRPGTGIRRPPGNAERLRLDFLPYEVRQVLPYGVRLNDIFYYSESIARWVGRKAVVKGDERNGFLVRYDPYDLSQVWLLDPELNDYIPVPLRDMSRPPFSLWDLKAAKDAIRERNEGEVDERRLFEEMGRLGTMVEAAQGKTRAARRGQHRKDRTQAKADERRRPEQALAAVPGGFDATQPTGSSAEDIFAVPVTPSGGVVFHPSFGKG